jgi:hypothetical protein
VSSIREQEKYLKRMRIKAYIASVNAEKRRRFEDDEIKKVRENFLIKKTEGDIETVRSAFINEYLAHLHKKQTIPIYNEIRRLRRLLKKATRELKIIHELKDKNKR